MTPTTTELFQEAISLIKFWYEFAGNKDWELYNTHSPEMKRLNTALEKASLPAEEQGKCQCCNKPYTYDLTVPDNVWEKISPKPVEGFKGGGLLCPECIVEKIITMLLPTQRLWIEKSVEVDGLPPRDSKVLARDEFSPFRITNGFHITKNNCTHYLVPLDTNI